MHTQASLQREPLIFSIGIWHDVRRYLVLRDVAGEDLETGDLSAPPFRFFVNADAVFFMFDPLRVKSIRDQLQDLLPAQTVQRGRAAQCAEQRAAGDRARPPEAGGDPVEIRRAADTA